MMKRLPLFLALFCALAFHAAAQPTAEKVAELKTRFARGKALAEDGKFTEALKIFKGILNEDPHAKGSLFMAGVMSNQLYQFGAAADYLDQFLKLEPQHTAGLINAVKANQSLDNDAKVDLYRERLLERRRLKADPVLNLMESYERQRIALKDGGYLSILETFEPSGKDPVYTLLRMSAGLRIVSKEELAKAPADGAPEMKGNYLWAEPHYKKEIMERYEIKKVVPALPSFKELRGWIVEEYADSIPKAE